MTIRTITVRELSQHTSAIIERVQAGEELLITVDGRPVAKMTPVHPPADPLHRLTLEGRVITAIDHSPLTMPPVVGDPSVDSAALYAQMRAPRSLGSAGQGAFSPL